MRVLAVDPGLTGALAFYDVELGTLTVSDMPTARTTKGSGQILDAQLVRMIRVMHPDTAVIELVHALPKQGVTSTFTFGVGFGVVRGVLAALEVPVSFLTPQEWRRIARVPGRGGNKDASRIRATQLFPALASSFSRVKDHGRADAALLAYAYVQLQTTI